MARSQIPMIMINDGRDLRGDSGFGLAPSPSRGGHDRHRRWQELSGAKDEPVAIARSGFSVRGPRTAWAGAKSQNHFSLGATGTRGKEGHAVSRCRALYCGRCGWTSAVLREKGFVGMNQAHETPERNRGAIGIELVTCRRGG